MKELIRKGFIRQYLEEGNAPFSVYEFCKNINIREEEFYQYYNSLDMVEKDVWVGWFEEVFKTLSLTHDYSTLTIRDKLLLFYENWVSVLRANRSYILLQKKNTTLYSKVNQLTALKGRFTDFINDLVKQSISGNEIVDRKALTQHYYQGFWIQFLYVLNTWIEDESINFDKTDATIEKAVDLSLKIAGENMLDDLWKFGRSFFPKK